MREGHERNRSAGPRGGHPFGCAPLPCRRLDHLGRQPSLANSSTASKDNAATFGIGDGARDEGKRGPSADERPCGRKVETVGGGRAPVRGNVDEGDGNPVPAPLVPSPPPRGSRAAVHPPRSPCCGRRRYYGEPNAPVARSITALWPGSSRGSPLARDLLRADDPY